MSGQHFRFLHASDFHLEQPLYGLTEIPEHLRDLFVEAPFIAAERTFDAAVRERVDFVVLSGDLIDPKMAGPRGVGFLLNQFERLAAHGIETYWCGGHADLPQDWPAAAKLPSSVRVYATYKAEEVTQFRGQRPVAVVTGRSFSGSSRITPGDYSFDVGNIFSIAVAYGKLDADRVVQRPIDYWALGGEHNRHTIGENHADSNSNLEWHSRGLMHYPGSPQGRCPAEFGPHGCTLVHVADDRTLRTQFIETDAVRWHQENLVAELDETRVDIKRRLTDRMQVLLAEAVERPVLVRWQLHRTQRFGALSKRREWAQELIEWLRAEYGQGRNCVWTLDVEIDETDALPVEWYDEETMLGDFLRVLRNQEPTDATRFDLLGLLPDRERGGRVAALADWDAEPRRTRLLHEAAVLGAQLLGAEDRE